jgi:hypothetical protein
VVLDSDDDDAEEPQDDAADDSGADSDFKGEAGRGEAWGLQGAALCLDGLGADWVVVLGDVLG